MILFGSIHCVGDDITSAQVCDPALGGEDPAVLAAHCLERVDPALSERIAEGDMLVAGGNFGAGEGAELAVLALLALGFAAVICRSAAPAFANMAEVAGLPVIVSPEAGMLNSGETVRIDLARSTARNVITQHTFSFSPVSANTLAAARRSAMLGRMRRVVEEEGFEG